MRNWFRDFDLLLFGTMATLVLLGVVSIYCAAYQLDVGAARPYHLRQLIWFGLGLVAMVPIVLLDYHAWMRLAWVGYALCLALLLAVVLVGQMGGGAQRWLGFGPFALQPSELMKLALLLVFVSFLDQQRERIRSPLMLLLALAIAGIPLVLILKQPDLGTALALVPMVAVLLYVGGAERRHLLILTLLCLSLLPVAWYVLEDYQRDRLLSFLNPGHDPLGASYQVIQSRIAVGSGEWFGKGWLGGTQTQLNFLPVQHTDFIFSVFAEQWGFAGSVLLLLLFAVLVVQGITIALEARDLMGSLLCMGVVTLLMFQMFVNLGMTMGLMPVTGLPLPFLSYGGSSLITFMLGIGWVLNVRLRKHVF